MTELYEAWHYKIHSGVKPDQADERQDPKLLGDYTSRARAETAIKQRAGEEGFRDWPLGFRIEAVPVDAGMPTSGEGQIARFYRLWHFRIGQNDEDDVEDPTQAATQLGLFSSEQNATAAIERFRANPRFRDFPDGFRISSGPPNVDYWAGGFIPWDEA